MKVVHVSPTYFHDASVVGGAERYAQQLARGMAEMVQTVFVSFGSKRRTYRSGALRMEIYPARLMGGMKERPLSLRFLRELCDADVVHCHHLGSPSTTISLLAARLMGKLRFVTPLGLLPTRTEHRLLRIVDMTGILCISDFSGRQLPYQVPRWVIFGGVDTRLFRPEPLPKERKAVCVARLRPHKGINYLVEALEPDMRLEIYGRPYDQRYYHDLKLLARGKDVHFFPEATDEDIARAYATALVSVLPSVYTDMYGRYLAQPELLGLVLLEAMACGTPVIGTRVGALPEFIQENVTGYVVAPNDPSQLRDALRRLFDDPVHAALLGHNGCSWVRRTFTWTSVAEHCLEIYRANE